MKICITSTGTGLESPVDERFGRARYLLIIDLAGDTVETVSNIENVNAASGAGIRTADLISNRKVEWVLTGHVGPKAFQALTAAGIKIGTGASGSVRETLERFKSGEFSPATAAPPGGGGSRMSQA